MDDGLNDFLRNLDLADQRVRDELVLGLNEFAINVLGRAQELCPISPTDPDHPLFIGTSGALRRSGVHVPPEWKEQTLEAGVGFHTSYAMAVHERLDANHQYPGAVNPLAQAKFLETALAEMSEKLVPFMAARVKEKLE